MSERFYPASQIEKMCQNRADISIDESTGDATNQRSKTVTWLNVELIQRWFPTKQNTQLKILLLVAWFVLVLLLKERAYQPEHHKKKSASNGDGDNCTDDLHTRQLLAITNSLVGTITADLPVLGLPESLCRIE
jgi:hypothetical protein